MCGIVGGIAERNVVPILLKGLSRLEYRGYDSSGIATLNEHNQLNRVRQLGKIKNLELSINDMPSAYSGSIGIAHTRWATHGKPSVENAHPHVSNDEIAVVHNGIIENYGKLKKELELEGYVFQSATDSEVIVHAIHRVMKDSEDLYDAVKKVLPLLEGAFAIGVIANSNPDTLVAARKGSPLVVGVGIGEHFIASDVSALLPVTSEFIFLEDGDISVITRDACVIYNEDDDFAIRDIKQSTLVNYTADLGEHRHFMHKEIHEQPRAISDTLKDRITLDDIDVSAFGFAADSILKTISQVQIIACGTSYHAAMVARYWFERILKLPTNVEVASEFRYREPIIQNNTFFVTVSQSGETADTLAALKLVNQVKEDNGLNIPSLVICNVPESSLTRESDLTFLTQAGPEIGVASTKAFSSQLVAFKLLLLAIGKVQNRLTATQIEAFVKQLHLLPNLIKAALKTEESIKELAKSFRDKESAIFLGRGAMYPIALEGALKLKEISYIHAEAYPSGELKHGPLALIDEKMPVISLLPNDALVDKNQSNLQEVSARGGQMIVVDENARMDMKEGSYQYVSLQQGIPDLLAPLIFNITLQLLSYHVALQKGTDVDQPRNLAKSVTVE